MSIERDIVMYSQDTLEYGKPSEGNIRKFILEFGGKLVKRGIQIDWGLLEGLESCRVIEDRGGKNFYKDIIEESNKAKFKGELDIEGYIREYKVRDSGSKAEDSGNGGVTLWGVDKNGKCIDTSEEDKDVEDDGNTYGEKIDEVYKYLDNRYEESRDDDMSIKDISTAELIKELRLREERGIKISLSDDTIKKLSGVVESLVVKDREVVGEYNWGIGRKDYSYIDIVGVDIEECKGLVWLKKALLISGVPGTGKTKLMLKLANELTTPDRVRVVSMGQDNMTYSDFMVGQSNENGKYWDIKDGIFLELCKLANSDREHTYVICIDELGRGQTESVFGELITGMESRDTVINISYGKTLVVPSNLIIIATRNKLDISTSRLDLAIQDRFTQVELEPQWNEEYMEVIAGSSDAYEYLKGLIEPMVEINKVFKGENKEYKAIGMRQISNMDDKLMDKEELKVRVKEQLIPVIRDRLVGISDNGKSDIELYIEVIEGLC